jgi:general stress protein 26
MAGADHIRCMVLPQVEQAGGIFSFTSITSEQQVHLKSNSGISNYPRFLGKGV